VRGHARLFAAPVCAGVYARAAADVVRRDNRPATVRLKNREVVRNPRPIHHFSNLTFMGDFAPLASHGDGRSPMIKDLLLGIVLTCLSWVASVIAVITLFKPLAAALLWILL
jgi:hypothetical protein